MPVECMYCGYSVLRTSELKRCPGCKRRGCMVFYPDENEIRRRAEKIKLDSLKGTRDEKSER